MELLSLKWNNHKTTFFHVLSNLRKKEVHTDVTLSCDNKFYPAHKIVLSSCSDYFSEVFEKTSCKSPVIILKDISSNNIECILDYMYLGEVDVKQSDLASLIQAAECLRIKGLAVPDEDPTCSKRKTSSPDGSYPKRSRHESNRISSNVNDPKQIPDANSSPRSLEKSSSPLIAVETIKLEKEDSHEDTQIQYEEKSYPFKNVKESFCDNVDFDADLTEFSKEEFDESLAGPSNKQNENSWTDSEGQLVETTLMQQPKMQAVSTNNFGEVFPIEQKDIKDIPCPICSEWIPHTSDLNVHLRIHTKERRFQCPHCTYKTSLQPNLRRHLLRHTGERPFSCPLCAYKATQKVHLQTHLLTHSK